MSQRILLPYDGSDPSRTAIEYVFETFADPRVTALHVVPTPEGYWAAFAGAEYDERSEAELRERGEDLLEDATELAAQADGEVETVIESGRPDREIVSYADAEDFDAIVIGSHGRKGTSRVLIGSVAERVVERASIPVMVVR